MSLSRREKIETMLIDDPQDIFLRYSLSIELAKEGRTDESLQRLRQLMREQPPYVAAFFEAGRQLVQQSRIDEARTVLRDGIDAARQQGDMHAAGEMSEFLTSLGPQSEGNPG